MKKKASNHWNCSYFRALRDLHSASLKGQVRIRQAIRKKFPGMI